MGSDDLLISKIKPNRDKALMLAKRAVGVLVHDSILLEGINFTLPEVQTLLEGVTVGGHALSDQQIAINQGNAWRYLFAAVKAGEFSFSLDFLNALHAIAGKEEALEWGCFRSGSVTISGSSYLPPKTEELNRKFSELLVSMNAFDDIYDKAIHVFLLMARNQFFYDVNKRTGRLMMNGVLLNAGYPPLNLSAKHKLKFNELMMRFYDSGDEGEMNLFMRSCIDPKLVEIMSE
jgi:Fic family protein